MTSSSRSDRVRPGLPVAGTFLLSLLLLFPATPAAAKCGDAPSDATRIAEARAAIKAQCACSPSVKRSDTMKCARGVVAGRVAGGLLPAQCQSSVLKCVSRSTCGRPGAVTCCVTNRKGKTTCSVKRSAAQCKAPSGGQACAGNYSSCCDSCTSTGCVPPPTPTPSPTPPPTPVPTPTPTPEVTPTPPDFCQPLVGLPRLATVPMTTTAGTTQCGGPFFDPPPAPPLAGQVNDVEGNKIADLGAGCLYASNLPPQMLLAGGTAMLDVVGLGLGKVVLGGSEGDGPLNCTKGAGPGRHCLNGNPGTDGNGTCANDGECGGAVGSCGLDGNCFFGPPVPVPNDIFSACSINAFLTDMCGEVDLLTQQTQISTTISARIYLTSNPTSPCPRCEAGTCTAGKRAGEACTPIGAEATSNDCPPLDTQFIGTLVVPFPALSTGTTTLTADENGLFCPGQTIPGAFGIPEAHEISVTGQGPGSGGLGDPLSMRLASVFCLNRTGGLVDSVAFLPAPGAVSAGGTIDLSGLLGLPLP